MAMYMVKSIIFQINGQVYGSINTLNVCSATALVVIIDYINTPTCIA